jgi:hypothetical protein
MGSVAQSVGRLSIRNADLSVIRVNSTSISVETEGGRIYVRMASSVDALSSAVRTLVWSNPAGLAEVWAPEIIKDGTTYYIYFTAGAGSAHRMYYIQSQSPNSGYSRETRMALPDNKWAIDGTAFIYQGQRWFVWSGWVGDTNDYCLADLRLRAGGDPTYVWDWYKSNGCLFGSKGGIMMSGWHPTLYAKGVGHHSFVLLNGDPNTSPPAGPQFPWPTMASPRTITPTPSGRAATGTPARSSGGAGAQPGGTRQQPSSAPLHQPTTLNTAPIRPILSMKTWRWALVGVALTLPAAASSPTFGVHPIPLEQPPGPATRILREAAKRSHAEDYEGAVRVLASFPTKEAPPLVAHVLKLALDVYQERARLAGQTPASIESLSALLRSLLSPIARPEWFIDQSRVLDSRALRLFSTLRAHDAATRETFERPLRVGLHFASDVAHEDQRAYTSTLLRDLRTLGFTPKVVEQDAELSLEVRRYSLGWAMNRMATAQEEALLHPLGVHVRWERRGRPVVAPYHPHAQPNELPCNGSLQLDAVCLGHTTARSLVLAWLERANARP